MALLDRQKEILEYLAEHNGASVSRLSKTVHASEATIRRDLTALEQAGKLRRTFGGAILAQKPNQDEPLMFREHTHLREKNIIADKAVKLISDSDAHNAFIHRGAHIDLIMDVLYQCA